MKENAISKINKAGNIIHVITTILQVCLFIVIATMLITLVLCYVFPENLFSVQLKETAVFNIDLSEMDITFSEEEKQEIEKELLSSDVGLTHNGTELTTDEIIVGDDYFQFNTDVDLSTLNFGTLRVVVIIVMLYSIMTLVTLFFLSSLAKAFKDCRTPFAQDIIKKMQRLAFSLIPWVLFSALRSTAIQYISSKQLSFSLELSPLLTMGIILALSYIFKYGAMLQQESDETL